MVLKYIFNYIIMPKSEYYIPEIHTSKLGRKYILVKKKKLFLPKGITAKQQKKFLQNYRIRRKKKQPIIRKSTMKNSKNINHKVVTNLITNSIPQGLPQNAPRYIPNHETQQIISELRQTQQKVAEDQKIRQPSGTRQAVDIDHRTQHELEDMFPSSYTPKQTENKRSRPPKVKVDEDVFLTSRFDTPHTVKQRDDEDMLLKRTLSKH
jgi:hypothetical protein